MRRIKYEKGHQPRNASKLHVGIVVSVWHSDITKRLLAGAQEILRAWRVPAKNLVVVRVAGSFEIPYGCLALAKKKRFDALIALGCIIKGKTDHYHYIASAVSHGIMQVSLTRNIPISFGVITAHNLKQAQARAKGDANKGKEAAVAALGAALLAR